MIPDRTLLILGAGASRPYQFPTGQELTNLILERDENPKLLGSIGFTEDTFQRGNSFHSQSPENVSRKYRYWLQDTLAAHDVENDDLKEFQERFHLSQAFSVDAFVADNPSYEPLAAKIIAAILLRCERTKRPEGDWYQLLFNELIDEHGRVFPRSTLSVITFNYDRSLEMYLHQAFKNRYDLDQQSAWKLVQKVEIIHVYGSLGALFNSDGNHELSYGAGDAAITVASKNLRLVGSRAQSSNSAPIRSLLENSLRIVFLGFGFDRLNFEKVVFSAPGKRVWASCFGLSSIAMKRAESSLSQSSGGMPLSGKPWIAWGDRSYNAVEFLHNSLALA